MPPYWVKTMTRGRLFTGEDHERCLVSMNFTHIKASVGLQHWHLLQTDAANMLQAHIFICKLYFCQPCGGVLAN